jgi:hypothetical protein
MRPKNDPNNHADLAADSQPPPELEGGGEHLYWYALDCVDPGGKHLATAFLKPERRSTAETLVARLTTGVRLTVRAEVAEVTGYTRQNRAGVAIRLVIAELVLDADTSAPGEDIR